MTALLKEIFYQLTSTASYDTCALHYFVMYVYIPVAQWSVGTTSMCMRHMCALQKKTSFPHSFDKHHAVGFSVARFPFAIKGQGDFIRITLYCTYAMQWPATGLIFHGALHPLWINTHSLVS